MYMYYMAPGLVDVRLSRVVDMQVHMQEHITTK